MWHKDTILVNFWLFLDNILVFLCVTVDSSGRLLCSISHCPSVGHPTSELIQESLVSGREREQCVMQSLLTAAVGGEYVVTVEKYIVATYMWKYVLQSNFPLDSQSKLTLKLWLHGAWRRKLNSFPKFWWTGIIYLHIIIIIDRCTHFCCSSCRQSQASCYLYLHAELNWVFSSYIRKCYTVCISLYFMILVSFPAYEH